MTLKEPHVIALKKNLRKKILPQLRGRIERNARIHLWDAKHLGCVDDIQPHGGLMLFVFLIDSI